MIEASLSYEARSEGLGFEFLDGVQRLIDLVREHPRLGRSVGGGFRRAVLQRFPLESSLLVPCNPGCHGVHFGIRD